jgi:ubiquinone/menaquinone biosynthesis C-methylase UbiE
MQIDSSSWDKVACNEEFHSDSSAFYLYKRQELISLIQNWAGNYIKKGKILKTDLIEEAIRQDHVLFWLAENNQEVFGMDISLKMTGYAKLRSKILNSKINFSTADIRYLPFKDNCFDLIISNSTCDHFPEIDFALKELYRVLKLNGTLIITLHNKLDFTFWLFIILKKIIDFIPELHWECCYTPQNMQNRLKKAGFFIQDFTTNLHVPFVLISLMTTLEKWITGKYHKTILSLNNKIIQYSEKIKEKDKIIDYLFSGLIACKAIKKAYNING